MKDLNTRKAKCTNCDAEVTSSNDLAFFREKLDDENDQFYCGCDGWD